MTIRIIGGQRRGQKLEVPQGGRTRPTVDMVREAIFNILAPQVEGRFVLDLFGGTGALGLEALSRGAARATFLERDRIAREVLARNIGRLRFEDRTEVLAQDAYRFVKTWRTGAEAGPWLVLVDPPYRDTEGTRPRINGLLEALVRRCPADSIIVFESVVNWNVDLLSQAEAWDVRRYGSTKVSWRTIDADQRAELHAHEGEADEDADGTSPPLFRTTRRREDEESDRHDEPEG